MTSTMTLTLFLYVLVLAVTTSTAQFMPVAFSLDTPPPLLSALSPNYALYNAEKIHNNKIRGPASIAIVNGNIYTISNGLLVNSSPCQPKAIANLKPRGCRSLRQCGMLTAIRPDREVPGSVLILDAYRGMYRVDTNTGKVQQVLTTDRKVGGVAGIGGRKPVFLSDFVQARDGTILISDSSDKYDAVNDIYILVEGRPQGRIISLNATSGETGIIKPDVFVYPNGLELTADETGLLVAESGRARILRVDISAANWGQVTVFTRNLPGLPSKIRRSERNTFWTGLFYIRHRGAPSVLDTFKDQPAKRKWSMENVSPATMRGYFRKYGMVVELSDEGKIIGSLHDPTGRVANVVNEVQEYDGLLYYMDKSKNYMARIVLPQGDGRVITVDSAIQVLRSRCQIREEQLAQARTVLAQYINKRTNKGIEPSPTPTQAAPTTSPTNQTPQGAFQGTSQQGTAQQPFTTQVQTVIPGQVAIQQPGLLGNQGLGGIQGLTPLGTQTGLGIGQIGIPQLSIEQQIAQLRAKQAAQIAAQNAQLAQLQAHQSALVAQRAQLALLNQQGQAPVQQIGQLGQFPQTVIQAPLAQLQKLPGQQLTSASLLGQNNLQTPLNQQMAQLNSLRQSQTQPNNLAALLNQPKSGVQAQSLAAQLAAVKQSKSPGFSNFGSSPNVQSSSISAGQRNSLSLAQQLSVLNNNPGGSNNAQQLAPGITNQIAALQSQNQQNSVGQTSLSSQIESLRQQKQLLEQQQNQQQSLQQNMQNNQQQQQNMQQLLQQKQSQLPQFSAVASQSGSVTPPSIAGLSPAILRHLQNQNPSGLSAAQIAALQQQSQSQSGLSAAQLAAVQQHQQKQHQTHQDQKQPSSLQNNINFAQLTALQQNQVPNSLTSFGIQSTTTQQQPQFQQQQNFQQSVTLSPEEIVKFKQQQQQQEKEKQILELNEKLHHLRLQLAQGQPELTNQISSMQQKLALMDPMSSQFTVLSTQIDALQEQLAKNQPQLAAKVTAIQDQLEALSQPGLTAQLATIGQNSATSQHTSGQDLYRKLAGASVQSQSMFG